MVIKVTPEEIKLLEETVKNYDPSAPREFINALDHLLSDWKQISLMVVNLGVEAQKVLEVWKKNGIIKT